MPKVAVKVTPASYYATANFTRSDILVNKAGHVTSLSFLCSASMSRPVSFCWPALLPRLVPLF